METVVPPPPDAELQLLTDWSRPADRGRTALSAALSLAINAGLIIFVLILPETFMQPAHRPTPDVIVTPLILPPLTLTQREPNKDKQIREFRSPDLTPRVRTSSAPTPEPQTQARKAAPSPPPPPKGAPQTPLPEPPKVEIATSEQPKLSFPVQPPQVPQPSQSPFEDVAPLNQGRPGGRGADLGPSVLDAIHGNIHGGPGINVPGNGQISSSGAELPQLLSDPQGVDFRAYLAHVLAAVRQYWFSILPASVKAGRRGNVTVQFAIQRDGTVRTVAFVQQTGDQSLDGAAIAAISGGGPFGPLPSQYRGPEIHVQMNFAYNAPKH